LGIFSRYAGILNHNISFKNVTRIGIEFGRKPRQQERGRFASEQVNDGFFVEKKRLGDCQSPFLWLLFSF